jgi:hypothetical protein
MENIYYLLLVSLIFWYFVYLRRVSECARSHITKYCKKEQLQFISISRVSSRIAFNKTLGPHWISIFDFEFSGDGDSSYEGQATLRGLKLDNIFLPPFRT